MKKIKNIFIELPTWLGDTVMTTPAIENLVQNYPQCQITFFGSYVSIEAMKTHPNCTKAIVDDSRNKSKYRFRLLGLKDIARTLNNSTEFDLAISFRRTFSSKVFMWFINAKKKIQYKRYTKDEIHQAIRYNDIFIQNNIFDTFANDLKLYFEPKKYIKPTLGINPGATYGSAKRWSEEGFSKVAQKLSSQYDIVIFGGPAEVEIANDICAKLETMQVKNYINRAGQTNIKELIEEIGGLDLFITNDSGPMHIGASFKVNTIAIFGPTKDTETSMWNNPNGKIVKKNLDCMPCMKRICPLGHHDCMTKLTYNDVLKEIQSKEDYNTLN